MLDYKDIIKTVRGIGFDLEAFDGDEIVIYTSHEDDTEHLSLYTNSWALKGSNVQAMAEVYHAFIKELDVKLKLELRL